MSTIRFTSDIILKNIKNLDPDQTHGHDVISMWMVKLWDVSFCKPHELIDYVLKVENLLLKGKSVQAVRLATLLKKDPSTGVSERAIRRSSKK